MAKLTIVLINNMSDILFAMFIWINSKAILASKDWIYFGLGVIWGLIKIYKELKNKKK